VTSDRKIRVLMAKVGLDTHDRGVKVLTMMLRDAGMEVIYTGTHCTPEEVVGTAIEEDVDVIGLSFMIGEYMVYTKAIVDLLAEKGVEDTLILVGGIVPKRDIPALKAIGVEEVFRADSLIADIVRCITENVRVRV